MDAAVETARAMHVDSLSIIISNRRSRRRLKTSLQRDRGSLCVIRLHQSTLLSRQLDMIRATSPPNFAGDGHQSQNAIRATLTVLLRSLWWLRYRWVKCGWYPALLPCILPVVTLTLAAPQARILSITVPVYPLCLRLCEMFCWYQWRQWRNSSVTVRWGSCSTCCALLCIAQTDYLSFHCSCPSPSLYFCLFYFFKFIVYVFEKVVRMSCAIATVYCWMSTYLLSSIIAADGR